MDIKEILRFEEGYREDVYYCSEGYPTIGIGTKIGPKNAPLDQYLLRVNITVANAMLEMELMKIDEELTLLPWFVNLDRSRKPIIQSMAYQLGVSGLCKFKKMIQALIDEDYEEAYKQALDSLWARQTPERANRHADVLYTGDLEATYGDI